MSKKNIFLLAAWYIAGGIISSIYGRKTPGELKNKLKQNWKLDETDFKILLDDFIDIHQNLLNELKISVLTEENKEKLNNLIDSYKNDWDEILKDLKVKWKEYITEAGYKLEKLYNEKKEELGDFKDIAPQKVDELKNNLISGFEDLKTQIKQKNK